MSRSNLTADVKPSASPPLRLGRKTLRLVLLGLPNAGKSSLEGALVEAAQGQQAAISVKEVEADLANLRTQLSQTHVFKADALLLVFDATDAAGDLDEILLAFGRALSFLEQLRGNRAAAGGWPVFLMLTKCDLLARPGDGQVAWKQRVDQLRKATEAQFQQFVHERQPGGLLPFGRIELRVRAAAVKPPALSGLTSKPDHLFGIADLLQQISAVGQAYQRRRARSSRRLAWTAAATLLLLAGMVGLAGFLFTQRRLEDPAIRELLAKIESYRARDEPLTASSRLREPLQPRIGELADLEHDAAYSKLPADKQDYVRERRRELEEYRAYQDSLRQLPLVASLRSEQELDALEARTKELALPPEHRNDWGQTDAAVLYAQYLEEIRGLRAGTAEVGQWYRNLHERGEGLASLSGVGDGGLSWSNWRSQLGLLFEQAGRPPHSERDFLPGSRLTYEMVYRFAEVGQARSAWEELHRRLEHLNNLTLALGLGVPEPAGAPLSLPADFTAEQAGLRVDVLGQLYPHYQEEFRPSALPEPALPRIRQEVRKNYDLALAAGRAVVVRHWREGGQDTLDTLASWQRLLPWLADPAELKAWRVLAAVLARLFHPAAADPVTALAAFLQQDQFELTFKRLYLELPDGQQIQPAGPLVIERPSAGGATPLASFELLADADHDARDHLTRYTFRPSSEVRLPYRPGEALTAELPAQVGGNAGYVLSWSRSRSQSYQFERLVRPPLLHRKEQSGTQAQVLEGVRLVISPADGLPPVPDLLPDVAPKSP
jgi:hypothetical protein